MPGTVVTFYSYKGGVGRTFALANIAVLLAQWRYRVLIVDWDIEAPGLANYFREWVRPTSKGVVSFLSDCEKASIRSWQTYTVPIKIPSAEGFLTLMPAGSHRATYFKEVQRIDWNTLYKDHNFGQVLETIRRDWTENFDFILIDARTGITDFSGVITAQLPDILAFLFTANYQSLDGACDVVNRAETARQRLPYDRSAFFALPIPARFEASEEYEQSKKWRRIFSSKLSSFVEPWRSREVDPKRLIEQITIPYYPYWSFGEEIAVLEEPSGSTQIRSPGVISYTFETIAAVLAHRLGRTDLLQMSRDDFVHSARRAGTRGEQLDYDVFISHTLTDGSIARDIAESLRETQFNVFLDHQDLKFGDNWRSNIQETLNRSRNMVVLFGDKPDRFQYEEVNTFLRQSIDDERSRVVIPVFTSSEAKNKELPTIVSSLQALNLEDGLAEVVSRLNARFRDIAEK